MVLETLEDTRALAQALAKGCFGGLALLLEGGMGAGKTTLTVELAKALGYEGAKSPTFALVHHYETHPFALVHADLYRLEEARGREFGFEEELEEGAVLVVEWPERLIDFHWHEVLTLHLTADPRAVTFTAQGPKATALKEALEALR